MIVLVINDGISETLEYQEAQELTHHLPMTSGHSMIDASTRAVEFLDILKRICQKEYPSNPR